METIKITKKTAQKLMLQSQKLNGEKLSSLEIIEHLGYVQIDTISVVERAHHHVFWSRNHQYRPPDLDALLAKRKVFEYWSHAAAYLPMRDYRFSLLRKKEFRNRSSSWFPRDPKMMKFVLQRIRKEGALRSKDFEHARKTKSAWWDWKPAKKALERLFMEGELEISRREGFQKVYDLPERVIPASVNTSMPSEAEYIRHLIINCLRHHGLATAREIAYLKKADIKTKVEKMLQAMLLDGELVQLDVETVAGKYYAFPDALDELGKQNVKAVILSPFDNFIIQRKKLEGFFDFDYQIECYVPQAKRKFGYFCLPILYKGALVARIDCKVDRAEKTLHILSQHYEPKMDRDLIAKKMQTPLKAFAAFNSAKLEKFL